MTTFEGMTEEDQLNALMSELKDSNIRQSVMEYIANKSEVAPGATDKQRLSKMIETIAAESVTNQKQSALWKSRTKKSILLGIVAVIMAITIQFLVNFFSNELSKESHVTGKGTMVGTDGSVVKTQMDEMKVNADGQLQGRSSVKTIKTTPSLNRVALASSLPDSTLMALDEVTVYSDKGHTLRIKVHGFARVPVLNSHCGNLVHFYTAWNGRITLDSTDLSFDKDTESHFKDAGFSLAVGGFGGRRLLGGSQSSAFFKHVDKLRKSGSWTCADVPLPASLETYMSREDTYRPCKEHDCYSAYGGFKLGVGKIAEAHALAAMPITSRMRALLRGSATEVFYVKSETTNIVSPSYSVEISTLPQHFGQEKLSILEHETAKSVTFQVVTGDLEAIGHCRASKEESIKLQKKAREDKEVDSEVHMEFLGLVQEGDKILRQWRWRFTKSMMKATGKQEGHFTGEFWDFAETLIPYRTLSPVGDVYIVESWSAKCTEADVTAALSLRTKVPIKDLLECKATKVEEEMIPEMTDAMAELEEDAISYYTWQVFGDIDAAQRAAAAGDKEDTLTQVADYLIRGEKGWSIGSVSDPCYLSCKEVMDASAQTQAAGEDDCENGAAAAIEECLKNSFPECGLQPLLSVDDGQCVHEHDEIPGEAAQAKENRVLEEKQAEAEADSTVLLPASQDGVANLLSTSPTFQATLAQTLGADLPKVVLNATRKMSSNSRRLAWEALRFVDEFDNGPERQRKRGRDRSGSLSGTCSWKCRRFGIPDGDSKAGGCPAAEELGGGPMGYTNNLGGRCPTCAWGQCDFMAGPLMGGTTMPMFVNGNAHDNMDLRRANGQMGFWWQFVCLSFSFCAKFRGRPVIISVQIKFAPVLGRWTFTVVLEACCNWYGVVMRIPCPPFSMSVCVGGQFHVVYKSVCHQLGIFNFWGGAYIRKSMTFTFYIYPMGFKVGWSEPIAKFEIGLKVTYSFHRWWQRYRCWRTDHRRRRRRYGKGQRHGKGGRRRHRWGCAWRWYTGNCDICMLWYAKLELFGRLRLGFDCYQWVKGGSIQGWIFFEISIPNGFGWMSFKWGWERFMKHCCFAKYNKR